MSASDEPVGGLADEAIKLIRALSESADADGRPEAASHVGPGCTYCPICQLIGYLRHTSPEVAEHLTVALSALTSAARSLVEAVGSPSSPHGHAPDGGVQNIDLSEEEPWD